MLAAVVLLAIALACAATAAPVAADSGIRQTPPPPIAPPGFVLQGSNGYGIAFYALEDRDGSGAHALLFVVKRGRSAVYEAPAKVSGESLEADLGPLGHVAVTFHATGTRERRCGSRSLPIAAGYYEGTIVFHGEEGYTDAEATRAPGDASIFEIGCAEAGTGSGTVRGPSLPGAELRVRSRGKPGSRPTLTAIQNNPRAAVRLEADLYERRGEIQIERSVRLDAPRTAFHYDATLRRATLRPPPPFSGRATFRRTGRHGARWSGNLTVDLPGHSGVKLTGGAFKASLFHARFEESGPLESNRRGRAAPLGYRARLSLRPPG